MRAMADDWEAGGPVREICARLGGRAARLGRPASAARRAVPDRADRRAPELEPYYPCLGGDAPPERGLADRAPRCSRAHVRRAARRRWTSRRRPTRSAARPRCSSGSSRPSGAPASPSPAARAGASAGLNLLVDRYPLRGRGLGATDRTIAGAHGGRRPRARRQRAVRGRRAAGLRPLARRPRRPRRAGCGCGRSSGRSSSSGTSGWRAALRGGGRDPAAVDRAGAGALARASSLQRRRRRQADGRLAVGHRAVLAAAPRSPGWTPGPRPPQAGCRRAAGDGVSARRSRPPAGPSLTLDRRPACPQPIADVEDHGGPVTMHP